MTHHDALCPAVVARARPRRLHCCSRWARASARASGTFAAFSLIVAVVLVLLFLLFPAETAAAAAAAVERLAVPQRDHLLDLAPVVPPNPLEFIYII